MTELTMNQMMAVEGGDIVDVIDGACAAVAVGAVFFAITPGLQAAGAFCAGWTLGRLFS